MRGREGGYDGHHHQDELLHRAAGRRLGRASTAAPAPPSSGRTRPSAARVPGCASAGTRSALTSTASPARWVACFFFSALGSCVTRIGRSFRRPRASWRPPSTCICIAACILDSVFGVFSIICVRFTCLFTWVPRPFSSRLFRKAVLWFHYKRGPLGRLSLVFKQYLNRVDRVATVDVLL